MVIFQKMSFRQKLNFFIENKIILYGNVDPKTQRMTKSEILKNDNVQISAKVYFWARKNPCGMPHRQKIALKHILD